MDFDGKVDFNDINDFVQALNNPADYENTHGGPPELKGDFDGDGDNDFDDIAGFVALFTSGAAGSVGDIEPAAVSAGPTELPAIGARAASTPTYSEPPSQATIYESARVSALSENTQRVLSAVVDSDRLDHTEAGRRRLSMARDRWTSPRAGSVPADEVRAAVWSEDFDWIGDRQ